MEHDPRFPVAPGEPMTRSIVHISLRMTAFTCINQHHLSKGRTYMFLTSEEREAIVFYKMTIDYKLPQSLSAQARYLVGDRPICYGTIPLKNGFLLLRGMHYSKILH